MSKKKSPRRSLVISQKCQPETADTTSINQPHAERSRSMSGVEAQALPAFRASRTLYVTPSAVKGRRTRSPQPGLSFPQAGIHPLFSARQMFTSAASTCPHDLPIAREGIHRFNRGRVRRLDHHNAWRLPTHCSYYVILANASLRHGTGFPPSELSKNYRVVVVSFFMKCSDNVHHCFVVTIEDSVVRVPRS